MTNPLVSVVIPVFNGENYLREALDSVFAQSWKNIETIIVDDGSTDQTSAIAKECSHFPNVTYIFQENSGQSVALNMGISRSNGDFLAFIDHDDLWEPDKTERQINVLSSNNKIDVVFGCLKNFAQNEAADKLGFQRQLIPGYVIGCMMIRRSSFLKVGYFDTEDRKGNFWTWFDRLKQMKLNMLLMDEVFLHRRVHGENWSICTVPGDYSDYFTVIRSIRKQRAK